MNFRSGFTTACAALLLSACASSGGAIDEQTAAWWDTTAALSGDDMEGRDAGSPGHARAAAYVADRFRRAGLRPAGDGGTWLQRIPFEEMEVTSEGTSFAVNRDGGQPRPLLFLHEISVTPTWGMVESLDAPLVFRGYCAPSDMTGVRGAVVVCFGTRRTGQTLIAAQLEAATAAGAVAMMRVDDMGFTIEPPRWPLAYARNVVVADDSPRPRSLPSLRLAAPAFTDIANASGQDGAGILARGARGEPMASFDFDARFAARFATRQRSFSSDNVLAVLPGTDPTLANEPVLLIAHLDGYGHGTPVNGDTLYNGALDDAAYVATLIAFAEERAGRGFRRPLVFAAVTAEEKGMLGSRWLAAHPTPAAPMPVAVLNLDQLRPLYPLKILTTLALDDSTLGQTVRDVAAPMGIAVRADLEPERNLLKRSDHWPFMQVGVPAVSFLFGFDAADEKAAAAYRDWYENRYHAPQDDISTPIDFQAQADFHRFYFALAEAVANAEARPAWSADSPYRPVAQPDADAEQARAICAAIPSNSPARSAAVAPSAARTKSDQLVSEAAALMATPTKQSLPAAIALLEQAVSVDPGNAVAYARLGAAHGDSRRYADVPAAVAATRRWKAATRAYELDAGNVVVLNTLAHSVVGVARDLECAERILLHALAIAPHDPDSNFGLSSLRGGHGDFSAAYAYLDTAIAHADAAKRVALQYNAGRLYFMAGEHRRVIDHYAALLAANPDSPRNWLALFYRALAFSALGDHQQALAEVMKAPPGRDGDAGAVANFARMQVLAGERAAGEANLQLLLDRDARGERVVSYQIAAVYEALGNRDEAFRWLMRYAEEPDGLGSWLLWLQQDPRWDRLRDDPRFAEVLAKARPPY